MKKLIRQEKGFTLVELLVVVAIIGILVAVAVPSLIGLTANAKVKAAAAEIKEVQTAMDAMMADKDISLVMVTPKTNDMKAFPTGNVLYNKYMRTEFTKGTYSCDDKGNVKQETTGYE